ncbi:MAG: glycosyltransferase family 2 protein [Tannerella sp.]|jgi:GT2 family glycosyltransferase|nr:glycosyltransferase family 2 protein [Tannerella sp.]
MKLSVVIVNYNVKYYLEQCLDSLLKSVQNIDSEVFVVDNCSTDDSIAYLRPKFPTVRFIENTENIGFSRANNQAIALSSGAYILLLNPDTVVGESTMENVCLFMDNHENTGALGVKMLDGYGNFLPESKRGFPTPRNSFTKMTGLSKLFPKSKTFGGYHLRYLDENEVHKVDILAGAFLLLRREAIEKAGSLDNDFFMYGEDIDLSFRIKQAGFDVYYLPEPIIHYKGESTRKDIRYVKRFYEAMLIFFNKHYPHSNGLFKGLIRLAILGTGFFSAIRKLLKIKTLNRKRVSKEILMNTNEYTYDQIIQKMNENTARNILFRIRHSETGVTIDTEKVELA